MYIMKNKKLTFIACVTVIAVIIFAVLFNRQKPQTIVCIGDSLTTCGLPDGRYTDHLGKWLKKHTVINKGINGDSLAGGRKRFEKDVIENSPDIVVIALGANDFWRKVRPIKDLKNDLEDMVKRAKKIDAEVIIASCFGDREFESEVLVEFGSEKFNWADAIAKMEMEIVEQYGCYYVPNMQIDIKPNGAALYWADRNHPNKSGNEFVAKRILTPLKKAIRKKSWCN